MRISYWSSDVCSSDLDGATDRDRRLAREQAQLVRGRRAAGIKARDQPRRQAVKTLEDAKSLVGFGGAEQHCAEHPVETLAPPRGRCARAKHGGKVAPVDERGQRRRRTHGMGKGIAGRDRKSKRLNSSH